MNISTITPTELAKLCEDGRPIDLIDVRTPIEFQELHAAPARSVPLDQLDPAALMRAHQAGGLAQFSSDENGTVPLGSAAAVGDCPNFRPTKMGLSPAEVPEPLYVICRSGSRGRQACEKFLAAGCTNVVNVEGGTQAWAAAGLPVVRGKKTVSLERQVRIAAGSLDSLGVLLAWLVHPAFNALSAFVGAGLIFAGLTDTCGLALFLARMPWNRTA